MILNAKVVQKSKRCFFFDRSNACWNGLVWDCRVLEGFSQKNKEEKLRDRGEVWGLCFISTLTPENIISVFDG